MSERVNIFDPVAAICERLGIDPSYAYSLTVTKTTMPPGTPWPGGHVTLKVYRGTDGRCEGPKYVEPETGEAATETLEFDVIV